MMMACVEERTGILIVGSVGTLAMACLTWFFSARRRLFIRTFVPPAELRAYLRSLPRGDDFRKGLRAIATIEFVVAALFATAALWCRT
jgi:hypothetical protein